MENNDPELVYILKLFVILCPLVSKSVDGGREKACVFGKLSKFVHVGDKKKREREKKRGDGGLIYMFSI